MRVIHRSVLVIVVAGVASSGLSGCAPSEGGGAGAGGTSGSAGASSGSAGRGGASAGTTGSAGTGGGAGASSTGGTTGTAGAVAGSGGGATAGALGTGGAGAGGEAGGGGNGGGASGAGGGGGGASGGRGGASGGGGGASGGRGGGSGGRGGASGGRGGATGSAGSGGGSGGTGSGGMCVRDQVAPNEVIFIGDSFIALGINIPNALEANARAAGSLGQNERYRMNAVSGALLGNNQIPNQYMNAVNAGPVKVVLMNGGGNDCLMNNPNPAYTAAMSLFQNMAQRNTETVVYFFYPDPLGTFASGNLKPCLDGLRPRMQTLCEGLTSPKCYFIDLRPGWMSAHTSDGIHTTPAGGKFVADKVWEVMQQQCIAQ